MTITKIITKINDNIFGIKIQNIQKDFMIASMTGYGRASTLINDKEILVEIRSINNRFLDIILKLPKSISNFEPDVKNLISQRISRGRVNVWVNINGENEKIENLKINKNLANLYTRFARQLKNEFGLDGDLDVNHLLNYPDVITASAEDSVDKDTWLETQKMIVVALDDLSEMRRKEGHALYDDFVKRIQNLEEYVDQIEKFGKNRPKSELDKLKKRIDFLLNSEDLDEYRLEQELAIIADRLDITEECVRFHSHNQLFLNYLKSTHSEGRKLNFLLQEMNREANTMSSKAMSSEISHLVVEIKDELEKLREQIQNVE